MNICLIGAGAIAQRSYLPFFHDSNTLKLTAVVETDQRITADLAKTWNLKYLGANLDAALDHADAAVICVPNHLHYLIAKQCLEKGKHVLCEKPICTKAADGEDLVMTASKKALVLSVAQVRRFYPAAKKIRDIIAGHTLGALKSFDFREGTVFSWPSITGFVFDKEKAGGGVLMDIGVHLLDLLFWWIDDEVASFQYADDNQGGVEATVDINLTFKNGTNGRIKLTRLSVLKNFYTLYFENGTLFWNPLLAQRIYIQKGKERMISKKVGKGAPFRDLIIDFTEAILDQRPPLVRAEEAVRTLRFMEDCYATRQDISMPWLH
jgi:predicted dehydrogenase